MNSMNSIPSSPLFRTYAVAAWFMDGEESEDQPRFLILNPGVDIGPTEDGVIFLGIFSGFGETEADSENAALDKARTAWEEMQ